MALPNDRCPGRTRLLVGSPERTDECWLQFQSQQTTGLRTSGRPDHLRETWFLHENVMLCAGQLHLTEAREREGRGGGPRHGGKAKRRDGMSVRPERHQ